MIGEAIRSVPRISMWGLVFLVIGAGLLTAGIATGTVHFAVAAAFPVLVGLTVLVYPRPSFDGELTERGIACTDPTLEVAYESIEGLWLDGVARDPDAMKSAGGPLTVIHEQGVLIVPQALTVPVEDVYRFLYSRLPATSGRDAHPKLDSYRRQMEEQFGPEKVLVYSGRRHIGRSAAEAPVRAGFIVALLVAAGWLVAGIAVKGWGGWIAAGVILLLFAFIGLMTTLVTNASVIRRQVRDTTECGLVISPLGIAVVQGQLAGKMRWDELTRIDRFGRQRALQTRFDRSSYGALRLFFEGGEIRLYDVFDHPLPQIHKAIMRFWRGEEPPAT